MSVTNGTRDTYSLDNDETAKGTVETHFTGPHENWTVMIFSSAFVYYWGVCHNYNYCYYRALKPHCSTNQINNNNHSHSIHPSTHRRRTVLPGQSLTRTEDMRWQLFTGLVALLLVTGSVHCQEDDFETDVSLYFCFFTIAGLL